MASLASLALRFRQASGQERDQLKWFLYATALFTAVYVGGLALRGSDSVRAWIAGLGLVTGAVVPISVGIAILKHRLYDIDRLINGR